MTRLIRPGAWVILFALMLFFIAAVSFGADLGYIPTQLPHFPLFDKLGHFMLYGVLAFLLHLALKRRMIPVGAIGIPVALVVVLLLCVLDEAQQFFVPLRASDLTDLMADTAGILFFILLAHFLPIPKLTTEASRVQ